MGIIIILSLHNTLYFKGMNRNLILPLMMILDGFEVYSCPKFLSLNPIMSRLSILLPDLQLRLPLHKKGIISYLPTSKLDAGGEGKLDRH